jgi:hypothetical protein
MFDKDYIVALLDKWIINILYWFQAKNKEINASIPNTVFAPSRTKK